jgi:hypothetical protein
MQGHETHPDGRSSSLRQAKYMLHLGLVVSTIFRQFDHLLPGLKANDFAHCSSSEVSGFEVDSAISS